MDRDLEKRILYLEEALEKLQSIELDRKYILSLKIISELAQMSDDDNKKEEHIKNLIEYADQSAGLFDAYLTEDLRGVGDIPYNLQKKQAKIKKESDVAIKEKISNCLREFHKIHRKLTIDYEKSQKDK